MTRAGLLMLALLALALNVGAALSMGTLVGFGIGRWWGEWELSYLMRIPQGGIVLSHRTNSYWVKLNENTLRFVHIPDPRQATLTRLFPERAQRRTDDETQDQTRAE